MRIAVLGIKRLPALAGADRVAERLLDHDPHRNAYVVYQRKRRDAPSCHGNRRYVYVPTLPGKHLGPFSYFLFCALHLLLRERVDVVHVHNSDVGAFVPLLRLKPRMRIVGTFHGDPYRRDKWSPLAKAWLRVSERSFATFCHRLTSVSRFRDSSAGWWGRRPVTHIPNGLDAGGRPAGANPVPGAAPGTYVLFACGRLDPSKGLHHLLDAYEHVADPPPLVIVGDFSHAPSYSSAIRARARASASITVVDRLLERADLMRAVQDARVFVFPSEVEGMSMMLLEALSWGATVVCSDIPENREVVGDAYPFLFPTRDPRALAATLTRALASGEAPAVAQARKRARAAFAWPDIVARYEAVYASVTRT